MSKLTKIGYDLDDVSIVQTPISPIRHRNECNPYRTIAGREMYPVIVSPMATVTDEHNYKTWLDNKFMCVVPRSVDIQTRLNLMNEVFVSFSLDEAENALLSGQVINSMINNLNNKMYVCIDLAHGTMSALYDACKNLKKIYTDRIEIMTGNVATPDAYAFYVDAGIDYVRCFIGSGSRCTSAANGGTYYPRATLLDEINDARIKWEYDHGKVSPTKVIADGGIRNFDDIQKCLALGADFVMIGNAFAKSEEACGNIMYINPDELNDYLNGKIKAISKEFYDNQINTLNNKINESDNIDQLRLYNKSLNELEKLKPYREYWGMSTKIAQRMTGGLGNKTSEGISKPVPIEYPIAKWADNMKSYLISTMSYAGCYDLDEFKNNTEIIINFSGDRAYRK
jgi:IMP dehydrogenase/GMP reductase